jgi:hypothetical protein
MPNASRKVRLKWVASPKPQLRAMAEIVRPLAAFPASSRRDRRRHVVALTAAGAKRLADAEHALEAVEDEVLGALDDGQREVLNNLLERAARGGDVSCPFG